MSQHQPLLVGVYNPRTPASAPPDFSLPRELARKLVQSGEAIWGKACRTIRLIRVTLSLRGPSACVQPKLIERYVDRESDRTSIAALIHSWAPGV